jgi:hypothetical protein
MEAPKLEVNSKLEVSKPALIPYEERNGRIYDFGIPRITDPEEQLTYILSALAAISYNNAKHINAHQYWENDEDAQSPSGIKRELMLQFGTKRPEGYCKSIQCKNNKEGKNPRWAIMAGENVLYNCAECLARHICESRPKSHCIDVKVIFHKAATINETELAETQKAAWLDVQFTSQGVNINGSGPYAYDLRTGEDILLLVYGYCPYGYDEGHIYTAQLKGGYVCRNVILGKCLALKPDYTPASFVARTGPPGASGWKEGRSNSDFCGIIEIASHCPACFRNQLSGKKETTRSPKSPAKPKSTQNNSRKLAQLEADANVSALEHWKKLYLIEEKKNQTLRKQLVQANAEIANLKLEKQMRERRGLFT